MRNKPFTEFEETRPSNIFYTAIVLCAVAVSAFLHHVVSPRISPRFSVNYKKLPWHQRMEWDSMIVSQVHAFIAFILGVYILKNEECPLTDPINCVSISTSVILSISTGYMLHDLVTMFFYYQSSQFFDYVFHHCLVILSAVYVVGTQSYLTYGCIRLLTEFSTLFLNIRHFFRLSGRVRSDRLYQWVNLLFSLSYIISRLGILAPFWVVWTRAHWFLADNWPVRVSLGVANAAGDLLNLYWSPQVFRIGWRTLNQLMLTNHASVAKLHSGQDNEKNGNVSVPNNGTLAKPHAS